MRSPWREPASFLVRVVMFGAAILLLAHGVHWRDVQGSVRHVSYFLLIGVVALNGVLMGIKALRLRWLLEPKSLTFGKCYRALLTSSAINNVVPFRGGDVARLWMLEADAGVTKSTAAAIAAIERLLEIGALALVALPASIGAASPRWVTTAASIVLAASVGLLVALAHLGRSGPDSARLPLPRGSVRKALTTFRDRFSEGLSVLRNCSLLGKAGGLSIAIWMVETMMVIICAKALGMVISAPLSIVTLVGINLALAVPSTPANVGPFEAGVVVVLTSAGFAKPEALAFGLIYHLVQILPVTVVGLAIAAVSELPFGPSPKRFREIRVRDIDVVRLALPMVEEARHDAEGS